jgi:hypothetical protein
MKKDASKSVKKKIVKLCKQKKVEVYDPKAFAGLLKTLKNPKNISWNLTNVGFFPEDFVVTWGTESAGFGNITFYKKKGKIHCESEAMSKEFVKEVLAKLVDTAIFDP